MAAGHGGWRFHRARWAAWMIGLTLSAVLGLGSLAWAAEDPEALQSAADAAAQRAISLDQDALSLAGQAAEAQEAADEAAGALDEAEEGAARAGAGVEAAKATVTAAEVAEDAERKQFDALAQDPAATPEMIDEARARLDAATQQAEQSRDTLALREVELAGALALLTEAEGVNEAADAKATAAAERAESARASANAAAKEAVIAAERARQARADDDARRAADARESAPPAAPEPSFDSGARPAEPTQPAPTAPAAPAPPTARARPVLLSPFPIVRIRGRLTRTGAVVNLVSVRAPRGARVSVSCRGRGCPARVPARTARLVTFKRLRRHLRAGAVLEIRVTRPGTIGKYTRFVIRRGKAPLRRDSCLRLNGVKPMTCPST